ncbi:MAG: protein kinase [Polyangiaceae bacterium]|jgi:WD40 repeat protein/Tfp pilus assembly protein PilF
MTDSRDPTLHPGDTLAGKYRVVAVLGRGATSITYEAERLEDGLHVALKELRLSRLDDWKVLDLFEREARVLANLTHPAIPAYVDQLSVERPEGPAFYLAQQLAPGRSLADRVAGGWRADEAEVKRIAAILLDILDYLHARLPPVYHRDIKPQNIVLGDGGKVWLVDFGAVRDIHRTTSGGSTVAGTFGYMAPEQLHGVARAESDLYALGATLLFLLTGRAPADLPHRKLKLDFRAHAHVSPPLAAWLDRMLEPAPEDRFHGARQALTALRDPTVLAPPRRRRLGTAILAGVLGVLVVTAAGVGIFEWHERERSTAVGKVRATVASLPGRPSTYQAEVIRYTRTIPAHFSPVSSAAYTPDGSLLLTGGFDQTVKIWDAHTGKAVRALPGHTGKVSAVRVAPDGHSAVTAGDHTLRVWSLPDGKPVRVIDTGPNQLYSADVSPSGKVVASGDEIGQAKLWTLDGTLLATLPHGSKRVFAVAFTPDGSSVVTGGDDPVVKVWNVSDGTLRCALPGHERAIDAVAIASDGQIVASASDDHRVKIWHIGTCRLMTTLSFFTDEVWTLTFSPDGSKLVAGGKEPRMAVWAMPESKLAQSRLLDPSLGGTSGLAFTPRGDGLVTGHHNGTAFQWTVAKGGKHPPLPVPIVAPSDPPAGATDEQRAYAAGLAVVDSYEGDSRVLDRAEALFRDMLKKKPESARAYAGLSRVALRRAHLRGDDYDPDGVARAKGFAERAAALDGTLPEAFIVLANAIYYGKDPPGARAPLDTALKLAPLEPGARLMLARIQAKNGDYEGSEATVRDVLARPARLAAVVTALYELIDIYQRLGDMDGADEAYRRSVELEPGSAWTKGDYAAFLIKKGDYDGAIVQARAALAQMHYGVAVRTLADAYCARGAEQLWNQYDPAAAKAAFDEAAAVDPKDACAPYGLGACEQYLAVTRHEPARFASAKAAYQRATSLDPDNALAKIATAAIGE